MLARKVVTRRGRRFRGYYPSAKLGRMVAWESLLERDAILLLEFSPGVVAYREQPAEIHYAFGTTTRTYYPDFEVVLANGKRVHVEVKTVAKLSRPEIVAKFTAVAEHYLRIKLDLRFITDEDIRPEPLQTNLRTLSYLVHHIEAGDWTERRLLQMLGHSPIPFRLCDSILGRGMTPKLIAGGMLKMDLRLPMSGDTAVFVGKEGEDATLLF